ncbi:hypothetical protein [Methylobacterium sp. J-067]|uniref:hypothetical protein n=1 Tax=Methylobacterium sp. J-067 TaxID=2836648 RepID=UPI001FB86CC6|nr:hypothetical protein [Methylobacterium sp. J-067]MCJ2025179.1 hypothetical protein [Methylobacterium sp. J-067]
MPNDKPAFSTIQEVRKRRHAEVSAESAAKRKGRNAPRRDDVARVALFVTLMQYRGSNHDTARAVVRKALMSLLTDAGYCPKEADAVFDAMVQRIGPDLDSYLMKRGISREVRNSWRARNGLDALPLLSAAEEE